MRSLFLKVFLWFWLATVLMIATLVLASYLTRSEQTLQPGVMMDKSLRVFAQTAVMFYEREGQPELVGYLNQIEREAGIKTFLFDAQGKELSGRSVPPELQKFAFTNSQTKKTVSKTANELMFNAHPVAANGDHQYLFVSSFELRRPPVPFSEPLRAQLLRLLAVILTASVLCYGLASYIVSPVIKLRTVTKQIAEGDLSARVCQAAG